MKEYPWIHAIRKKGVTIPSARILEIGCAAGAGLKAWALAGAHAENLFGIDVREDSIAAAKESLPQAHLVSGSAEHLGYPDGYFDVVIQSNVFSTLTDDALRSRIAQEMQRVCRPQGFVVWYDTPSFTIAQIRALFPEWTGKRRCVTNVPFLRHLPSCLLSLLALCPFVRTLILLQRKGA